MIEVALANLNHHNVAMTGRLFQPATTVGGESVPACDVIRPKDLSTTEPGCSVRAKHGKPVGNGVLGPGPGQLIAASSRPSLGPTALVNAGVLVCGAKPGGRSRGVGFLSPHGRTGLLVAKCLLLPLQMPTATVMARCRSKSPFGQRSDLCLGFAHNG